MSDISKAKHPTSPSSSDGVITLSRFRADINRALLRRGKKLLEATNLAEQVATMAPLEAYFVVKELGVESAVPILMHATAEQLQACVDLDCWDGDTMSCAELDAWLAIFAGEGQEALAGAFLRLDHEVQTIFLAESFDIYDVRSEEEPPVSDDVAVMTTQDSIFVLHRRGDEREVEPFFVVDALYKYDMQEAFRLLMAAKWEIPSDMTEQAWQFRSGRMQDLGFPSPESAARLFTPPPKAPPESVAPPLASAIPAIYAGALTTGSLLTHAMGRVAEAHLLDRLEAELVYLINAAVVAWGESPRDLRHVTDIAARVRDTISLGIEALLSPNGPLQFADGEAVAERAVGVLRAWPLLHLFQHGAAPARDLGRIARALAQDPVVAMWLASPLAPDDDPEAADRAFLRALVAARPLYAGFDKLAPTKDKAFATKTELATARARLDGLASRLV